MEHFWKTVGLLLIGLILWITVDRQGKDFGILLTLAICCAGAAAAAAYLQPVLELVQELETLGDTGQGILRVLLRSVGVGVASELVAMLCRDGGNSSLAGIARLLGSAGILYLSIPLLQTLMNLIQEIFTLL